MMKKVLSVFLLLTCLFISSCSRTVKLSFNEEGMLSDGTSSYRYAPVGYEPTYQGEEYGVIKGTLEEKLYKIGTCDPKLWLTTEYSGAATLIYYSSEITLPTLSELKPEKCFACDQDSSTFSVFVLGENKASAKEDAAVIEKAVELLSSDSADEIWPRADVSYTYDLKFYSSDWEAIYYNVVYAVCDGGNFLYDRVTEKCVEVGDLFVSYYETADMPDEDTSASTEKALTTEGTKNDN